MTESNKRRSEEPTKKTEGIVRIAKGLGVSPASLAIRWTMQKDLVSIPLVGARTNEQMQKNLEVLKVEIPGSAMKELDKLTAIELGFPHDFLSKEEVKKVIYGGTYDQIVK
ncbi:aldo/keto reductase [Muriicola sp. Z0-33]|nr:aldo/keto reductase [Muriicola sp. Z0-33]